MVTDTGSAAETAVKPRRFRWVAVAVVVVAVLVGAGFGLRVDRDPTIVDSPLIGKPAPAATLPELEGPGSVTLGALRGRVVVVNFWASWCVPCREEQPELLAAAAAYAGRGVVFVGVDFQDQRSGAVKFLDELGRGQGYRYVTDPGSQTALDFGVFGVPETFLIDRRGVVAAKITGGVTVPLLSAALDDTLAGRSPRSTTGGPVQRAPDS